MSKAEREGSRAEAEADDFNGGAQENRGSAESAVGEDKERCLRKVRKLTPQG
jgi:hypothetical protein